MLSILIPTHNRCEILGRTLDSLSRLRLPADVTVELIVVANACADDTRGVVEAWTARLPMPTRCVVEDEAGLNVARNRALAEARGDILAFLDDDVWVDETWCIALIGCYRATGADLVAGRVVLWWEVVQPPTWYRPSFSPMLSEKDHGTQTKQLFDCNDAIGANFSFTRRVLEAVGDFRPGLDRVGNVLLGCGDSDYLAQALAAGFKLFYAPDALVKHWVAPERATPQYLYRIAAGNGLSRMQMKGAQSPLQAMKSWCGHAYLVVSGGLLSALFRLAGRRDEEVRHGVRMWAGVGGLRGLAAQWRTTE